MTVVSIEFTDVLMSAARACKSDRRTICGCELCFFGVHLEAMEKPLSGLLHWELGVEALLCPVLSCLNSSGILLDLDGVLESNHFGPGHS